MKPLLLVFCALLLRETVLAATVTFSPLADTTISEDNAVANPDGFPSSSSLSMVAGRIANGHSARSLLRFDLSRIPSDATVTSVSLAVIVTKRITLDTDTHALHRMNVAWTESGATWVNSGVSPWTAGGNFAAASDATIPMAAEATYTFLSTTGLVNTVQTWVTNSASNHGWLLRSLDETTSGNARRIATHEDAFQAPVLRVDYVMPVPAVTMVNARVSEGSFRFEFTALAQISYTVEYKESLNQVAWTFLENFSNLEEETVVPVADPLTTNRFYRVTSP